MRLREILVTQSADRARHDLVASRTNSENRSARNNVINCRCHHHHHHRQHMRFEP
jgi:hypothetical protein